MRQVQLGWIVKARVRSVHTGGVLVKVISNNFTNHEAAMTFAKLAKKEPEIEDAWVSENYSKERKRATIA